MIRHTTSKLTGSVNAQRCPEFRMTSKTTLNASCPSKRFKSSEQLSDCRERYLPETATTVSSASLGFGGVVGGIEPLARHGSRPHNRHDLQPWKNQRISSLRRLSRRTLLENGICSTCGTFREEMIPNTARDVAVSDVLRVQRVVSQTRPRKSRAGDSLALLATFTRDAR